MKKMKYLTLFLYSVGNRLMYTTTNNFSTKMGMFQLALDTIRRTQVMVEVPFGIYVITTTFRIIFFNNFDITPVNKDFTPPFLYLAFTHTPIFDTLRHSQHTVKEDTRSVSHILMKVSTFEANAINTYLQSMGAH